MILKRTFACLCLLLAGLAVTAQERPRLVVGVVVDQMRWDYLYRYYDLYGEGGFKRLMNEGFNCENTMINYIPSITAVGHTSVYTGSVPSIHGIVGNHFFVDGKYGYCAADSTVKTVDSNSTVGQMSPRKLLATTIGDELKIATGFKSKVVGVALKDRAAIMPAGHSADAAYWIDGKAGRFVTSTYYMQELPAWAERFNSTIGNVTNEDIWNTSLGNRLTAGMAQAAVEGERLGMGEGTDMLTVSFSCTDVLGHRYGTHSDKVRDIYLDVDRRLAGFMSFLDEKVGKGQYLLFLTADHGAANGIKMLQSRKIPADGFMIKSEMKAINDHLAVRFATQERLVSMIMDYKVCIDREAAARAGASYADVKAEIMRFYAGRKNIAYVIDLENVAAATVPAVIREKTINGYNRLRGGDVQLIMLPAHYDVWDDEIDDGTTHGTWNPYDAHIPFLLTGWNVPHGSTTAQTYITDIAATVCALIHVQMPNGCIGTPVTRITDR